MIPSYELRFQIMREKAGLIGKKAWFLLPNSAIQTGKPKYKTKWSGEECKKPAGCIHFP